ncbi:hypothetical protein QP670_24400, partial [Escherichia coli]|nr:hypothetical protein [Escherichia coli]
VGTVTPNVAEAVKNAKAGQVRYRNDKIGIIHTTIGKVDFDADKLKENLEALLVALVDSASGWLLPSRYKLRDPLSY